MATPYPQAPEYRGRHRESGRRARDRVLALLLLLATLVVGTALIQLTPDFEDRVRPFARDGEVGDEVDVREFAITVIGIRGSARIRVGSALSETVYPTDGVWLLVNVRARAFGGTAAFRDAWLESEDGRLFGYSMRPNVASGIISRALQPGIPVEGEIVFEVPKDVAGDVTLLVSGLSNRRLDARARIRIRTDPATVRRWVGSTEALTVANATVVNA